MRATYSASTLGNAPHILAPGLEVVFGQPAAHGFAGNAGVLGEADHLTRQQFQGPAGAALRRLGTGCRNQQGFLFARELTACSWAWQFAERCLQVAEHEALLGPVDGRAAGAHAGCDIVVAGARVGSQQNLRSFELARCLLAPAQKSLEFRALG